MVLAAALKQRPEFRRSRRLNLACRMAVEVADGLLRHAFTLGADWLPGHTERAEADAVGVSTPVRVAQNNSRIRGRSGYQPEVALAIQNQRAPLIDLDADCARVMRSFPLVGWL